MPTALMRIPSVRLGADATLAPLVFGKSQSNAAKPIGDDGSNPRAEQQIA